MTELEVLQQTPAYLELMQEAGRNTDTPKFHHAQTCTFTPHYLRPFYEDRSRTFFSGDATLLQVPEEELEQYAVSV